MPTPPERSDRSQPVSRTPDRTYIAEVRLYIGQWRHTAESYGLTRQLNPERQEDAALLADPRRQGYEQAIAVIASTLADTSTLEELMRRSWYDPHTYVSSAVLEPSAATSTKRGGKRRKQDQEKVRFHDLLVDVCTRYSPDDRPLTQHVVLAAAYYRRATQLLSGWWTGGAPLNSAEQPAEQAQGPAETPVTLLASVTETPKQKQRRKRRVTPTTPAEATDAPEAQCLNRR